MSDAALPIALQALGLGAGAGAVAGRAHRRNTVALLGDSRMAETILAGPAHGSLSIINQANALSGARVTPVYNGAVGGYRSDQYLANLGSALNSGADTIAFWGWYNDINQGYTDTQIWSGYNGQIGTFEAFNRILSSGRRIVIFAEAGGTGFSTTQKGYVLALNQRLREYAASNHGVVFVDITSVLWDPTATSGIAFRANVLRDVVHPSPYGYHLLGAYFAPILQAMFYDFTTAGAAQFEYDASLATTIGVNRVSNSTFQTASGGTAGTGITGTAPSAVAVTRTGSATATISLVDNADGFGKDLVIAANFTTAGEAIKVSFTMGPSNWFAGDIFRAGVTAYVDAGATNFAGVDYSPSFTTSAGVILPRDMYRYLYTEIPGTAYKHTLRTPVVQIAAGATLSGIANDVFLYGAGSGSATVRLNRPWVRKQFARI